MVFFLPRGKECLLGHCQDSGYFSELNREV